MEKNHRKTGTRYERIAGEYLKSKGYEILEYNYRSRTGEIDIIARDGEYLVFCEVKYRRDSGKGSPLEAVGPKKQRVIYRCASHYLMVHGLTEIPCRFDVIGIERGRISHIRDAFCG